MSLMIAMGQTKAFQGIVGRKGISRRRSYSAAVQTLHSSQTRYSTNSLPWKPKAHPARSLESLAALGSLSLPN